MAKNYLTEAERTRIRMYFHRHISVELKERIRTKLGISKDSMNKIVNGNIRVAEERAMWIDRIAKQDGHLAATLRPDTLGRK